MEYLFSENVLGLNLSFKTNQNCFSPRSVDKGTLAMLSYLELKPGLKTLDLGCGYGVVGIYCAKSAEQLTIVMSDINKDALIYAKQNILLNDASDIKLIQSDGFENIDETGFDLILSNPPYHADFSVPKKFIEKGFNRLKPGGAMLMVTKRKEWYKNKFISIFGGVRIFESDGYFVFMAMRNSLSYGGGKAGKH